MNDNYDDIKKTIEDCTPKRPESLSRESMVELIKSKGIEPAKKPHRVIPFKRILSAVAAVAVIVGAVAAYRNMDFGRNVATQTTTAVPPATTSGKSVKSVEPVKEKGLSGVTGYSEIENYFLAIQKEWKKNRSDDSVWFYDGMKSADTYAATVPAATQSAVNEAVNTSVQEASAAHGETNTQVEGVDEADIIKNDGKYLYTVTDGSTLSIVDALSMKLMSRIELKSSADDKYINVQNIYLNGNTLVAICNESQYYTQQPLLDGVYFSCDCYYGYADNDTVSIIYDVSDRAKPTEMRRFSQDGWQISSRMVGSVLYSVSQYDVNIYQDGENALKDGCVPTVDGARVLSESIRWKGETDKAQSTYIVLTAFDTAQVDSKPESFSMLGNSNNVYCTASNMYIYESIYDGNSDGTAIYAVSIDGTKLSYRGEGKVPGQCVNQYSLDEYKGYLRVATTSYDYSTYVDVSSVYVLDENLKQVGAVKNLVHDEKIQSVRFMGDTAYVVTFLNTDPLFVIDLSTPTAPKAVGEVKLPGFSSYLHPVGDSLILGVGYDGDENSADYSSVKLSLFNVKNPAKPYEVDSYVVDCATTGINYDPKAFMYYPEKNLVGIPMVITKDSMKPVQSFMVVRISPDGLELLNGFVHDSGEQAYSTQYFRGTYIGNNLYTLTDSLIKRHDLTSKQNTGTIKLEGFAQKNNYDVYTMGAVQ